MKKPIFALLLACFLITGCAEPEKHDPGTPAASGPTLASKLITAQLVRNWVRHSDSSKLTITSSGAFSLVASPCTLNAGISAIDSYPQNQCLAGVATCGVIHLDVTDGTACTGFTQGTPGICSYFTRGYELEINCGGHVSDTQTFQWE